MFSHPSFINEQQILFFDGRASIKGYYIYDLNLDKVTLLLACKDDGHPTLVRNYLVTDTYVNRYARQYLKSINLDTRETFYREFVVNPKFQGDLRCDLHPKVINCEFIVYDYLDRNMRCVRIEKLVSH